MLLEKIRTTTHSPQIAIAPTVWAAAALARVKSGSIIDATEMPAALLTISLCHLRLDLSTQSSLYELGIYTCGDLLKFSKKSLNTRYRPELAQYIDELVGLRPTTLLNIPEEKAWIVEKNFSTPARTSLHLMKSVELCLYELCRDMAAEQIGVMQLELIFTGLDKKRRKFLIGCTAATRDLKKILQLITLKLENFNAGLGVETIRLEATQTAQIRVRQGVLEHSPSEKAPHPTISQLRNERDLTGLADLLTTRLGEENFFRLMPAASHDPERSIEKVVGLAAPQIYPEMPCGPRPIRLVTPPQPVTAIGLLPDHPPKQIKWRHIILNITKADGPERIEPEWWRSDQHYEVRDYFRLEDSLGRRLWVFRQGTPPQWFLHGVFA